MTTEAIKTEKACRSCARRKLISDFSNDVSCKDGKNPWCKTCVVVNTTSKRKTISRQKFSRAKEYGSRKGMGWSIDIFSYFKFLEAGCLYCGRVLPDTTGACLDRIDNSKGYQVDNVNPCCYPCNTARNNNFTVQEMVDEIGPAIKRIREKRLSSL